MTHCICTVYRLETVDGYYLGQVQWILDTAVSTLIVEYKFNWLTGILNLSLNFHLHVEYSQLPFTPSPPPPPPPPALPSYPPYTHPKRNCWEREHTILSLVRIPRMSGYFGTVQMCAVKQGLAHCMHFH